MMLKQLRPGAMIIMMLRITPAMGGYGRRRDGHRWTGRLICLTFARGNALFIPLARNHSSFLDAMSLSDVPSHGCWAN